MVRSETDPMIDLALAFSTLVGQIGFAFVEDEHLEVLADALREFFTSVGIPINEEMAVAYYGALTDPGIE